MHHSPKRKEYRRLGIVHCNKLNDQKGRGRGRLDCHWRLFSFSYTNRKLRYQQLNITQCISNIKVGSPEQNGFQAGRIASQQPVPLSPSFSFPVPLCGLSTPLTGTRQVFVICTWPTSPKSLSRCRTSLNHAPLATYPHCPTQAREPSGLQPPLHF